MSRNTLRDQLREKVNEEILYIGDVVRVVENLGGNYAECTIRNHLRNFRLLAKDYSVNPEMHGCVGDATFYTASKVWDYLQNLEQRGKIQLKERDIENIEQILERGYHKHSLGLGGSTGRRVGRSPREETSGSWDNAVKAYEGD